MRRQTLGALSPGQLNVRAGQTAGRVATSGMGKDSASQESAAGLGKARKSMAPAAAAIPPEIRRSSAFAGTKASGPRQDPRPLNDKNFIASCIRTVITYLSTHGFPAAIAPKTLASPTGKDFTLIVQFLFQRFDPNLKSFGKIEDEVPMFFKRLNYPFQISKSALFAVGSPHSWPAVLAALTWLVELLNYNEKADEQAVGGGPGMLVDEESATKRQFFEYICTSYRHFLAGDDLRCQVVDEEMLAQFKEKEQAIAEQHARMKEANDALVAELERMRNEPSPLAAAQAKKAEHEMDLDKLEKLVANLQTLKASLTHKLSERSADLSTRQEAMAAARAQNEALRARIAAQPVNKADMNRMALERTKQKEVLEAVSSQAEEMERRVHAQEVQFVSELKRLEGAVSVYNQAAHRLKLVPATAKRADGVSYELRLNREGATPGEFCNLDLKGVIRPGLERLCEVYRTKARQLSADVMGSREELKARREAIAEKGTENGKMEEQITKLEAQLRSAREAQEGKVRSVAERAEVLKDEVEGMRVAASHRAADAAQRRAAVAAEHDALQRSCEAELRRLQGELQAAFEAMLQHRLYVQQRLQEAVGQVQAAAAEAAAVPLPAITLTPAAAPTAPAAARGSASSQGAARRSSASGAGANLAATFSFDTGASGAGL